VLAAVLANAKNAGRDDQHWWVAAALMIAGHPAADPFAELLRDHR
jgi:hypothetical protein